MLPFAPSFIREKFERALQRKENNRISPVTAARFSRLDITLSISVCIGHGSSRTFLH